MGGLFSWFKSSRNISVTFVDTAGTLLFRSEIPSTELPETFVDLNTTFHIMGEDWHVVRAEPMTAEEYIRSGKLTIIVHKVEAVSLADLRFSLPTIDTTWAFTLEDGPDDGYILNLHEDDWRQHEFFPATDESVVQEEMHHIIAIWRNKSERSDEGCIFSACHKRTIPAPDLGISVNEILALLQPVNVGVVAINGGHLKNSIAFETELHAYYGTVENGRIKSLGMFWGDKKGSPEIIKIIETYNLIFVNWPECQVRTMAQEGE